MKVRCGIVGLLLSLSLAAGAQTLPPATAPPPAPDPPQASQPQPQQPDWKQQVDTDSMGAYEPGDGYTVFSSENADLNISAYVLVRWIDQLPPSQTFVDHLGRVQTIDPRNDIQFHRVMLYFKGFLYNHNFHYSVIVWSVNSTGQVAVIGTLGYTVNRHLTFMGGVNGLPGTRSLQGSHPYWLGSDRVMADDFFRPGFTGGIWATGQILPRVYYTAMLGNNLSQLGINAAKLTRNLTPAVSIWLLPTTGEFGPRGGFGDYEWHHDLATRFGVSYTYSREDRFNQIGVNQGPDNTQTRLADSLLLFATGSLAPGVTVQNANFYLFSADAGMKTHGFFLQSEIYSRLLDRFNADGPLPMATIRDTGYYIQMAQMVVPKRIELYASTSWVYGDRRSGFGTSHEWLGGLNYFPAKKRNLRMNLQVIRVFGSAMGSTFGYYVGGQSGTTLSAGVNLLF